jgi:hypothetical protein
MASYVLPERAMHDADGTARVSGIWSRCAMICPYLVASRHLVWVLSTQVRLYRYRQQ